MTVLCVGVAVAAAAFTASALNVSETRYRGSTVTSGFDLGHLALSALVLPVGAAFFANAARPLLRARRRDLATLRALGWRQRQVQRQLLQLLALMAFAGGLLAVFANVLVALLGHRPMTGWTSLGLPAAAAMTFGAAVRPLGHAAQGGGAMSRRPIAPPGWQRWPLTLRNLRQQPVRAAAAIAAIAVTCSVLGAELSLRWGFGGTGAWSMFGRPVWWQADGKDIATLVATLALTTMAIADLDRGAATSWTGESRTLQALGWPAARIVGLVAAEMALLGLAGGLLAGAGDLAGCLVVVHRVPGGAFAGAAVAVAAALAVSLAAAMLSAVLGWQAGVLRPRSGAS